MSPTSRKRRRTSTRNDDVVLKNPTTESFLEAYGNLQVVHLPAAIKNGIPTTCQSEPLSWKDIKSTFVSLDETDKCSWCIENGKEASDNKLLPGDFLDPEKDKKENDYAYCSFLIQNDETAKKDTLARVPLAELPFSKKWKHGPSIWVFFGRNTHSKELQGRPEHTDSVSHDGTWHYQLSGTKTWYLRPTQKLLEHFAKVGVNDFSESDLLQIDCHAGDVLFVNTRLWWHQTVIPSQSDPSVSYARDFYFEQQEEESGTQQQHATGDMTNVDGLYASNDVEKGTIIFTENDMPDCELHRSSTGSNNCEVVELEDGTSAVVSVRDITAGEFFCVPESDSEEEEEEEEEEEVESDEEDDDPVCIICPPR